MTRFIILALCFVLGCISPSPGVSEEVAGSSKMLTTTAGFLEISASTTQQKQIKQWVIQNNDPDADGISLYLTCDIAGGGLIARPANENPVWEIVVDHQGSSKFLIDAIRGASIAIPANSITLGAKIENPGTGGGLGNWTTIFGFTAVPGMIDRSEAEYTIVKTTLLNAGASLAFPIPIPSGIRALTAHTSVVASIANVRVDVLDAGGVVTVQQFTADRGRTILVGNGTSFQVTNTALVAQSVSIVGEVSF